MNLQANIIPLLPPAPNPLALGALEPSKAIWPRILLSQFPGCIAPSYLSSRMSFPGCWHSVLKGRMPQHGRDNTCTEELLQLAKLAPFPQGLQVNDSFAGESVPRSLLPVLAPFSSNQEVLGGGLRELQTACTQRRFQSLNIVWYL